MRVAQNLTDRQNNYDLLRIVATIAVVFIHVNYQFFQNYAYKPTWSVCYVIESSINIVMRFSVPVFVMMSGAFNLRNKNNSNAGNFYKKTTWKIFVPAAGATFLFLVIEELRAAIQGTSKMVPIQMVAFCGVYNLWFVYMLAGLYLLTPLLIKVKEVVSRRAYVVICIFLMVWAVGSQAFSGEDISYSIGVVYAFLGYYILGDLILNEVKIKHKTVFYFFIAATMFCLTFVARFMGVTRWMFNAYTSFFSPTITIASICIFMGIKQLDIKKDFSWLAGKTFYIYIFHTIVYSAIFDMMKKMDIVGKLEPVVIVLITMATFFIALICAVIYDAFWTSKSKWEKNWNTMKIWNVISEL